MIICEVIRIIFIFLGIVVMSCDMLLTFQLICANSMKENKLV